MGSPKPLLPLGNSTYIETILATLSRARVHPVVVVLGHEAPRVQAEAGLGAAQVLVNDAWAEGMLSSLQSAVRALEGDPGVGGLLVALVDSPRFSHATVRALEHAWGTSSAKIVVPAYDRRHGHPVIFDRSLWPALLAAAPERGARAVVDAHRSGLVEVPVDDPWVLRDADTPAEHRRMLDGR